MKKNKKESAKATKNAGKNKLPAGTPSSAAEGEGYGVRSTTDPAVPNRAHTEM